MTLQAVRAPSPITVVRASWRRIPWHRARLPTCLHCAIVYLLKSLPPQKASEYMALTGKQVRQLRALAHHLNPVVHIGKADVTDAIAKQAEEALDTHELIKCSVQDGSLLSCREAADQLAELVGAEVVQVIGHRFSLYRASSRKDIEHIKLG